MSAESINEVEEVPGSCSDEHEDVKTVVAQPNGESDSMTMTIPAEFARRLDLAEGEKLFVSLNDGAISVQKVSSVLGRE